MIKLVKKAKRRDADAFTKLMQSYMQDMYRVAISIVGNDDDAGDAINETILNCWEKIDTLKNDNFFKTWLIRILINNCYDIVNQRSRFTDMAEYEEPYAYDNYNLELKEALATLDETYRPVIMLYYGEGYPISEIARLLKISESAVSTRLARAREKLAKYYYDESVKEMGKC